MVPPAFAATACLPKTPTSPVPPTAPRIHRAELSDSTWSPCGTCGLENLLRIRSRIGCIMSQERGGILLGAQLSSPDLSLALGSVGSATSASSPWGSHRGHDLRPADGRSRHGDRCRMGGHTRGVTDRTWTCPGESAGRQRSGSAIPHRRTRGPVTPPCRIRALRRLRAGA